MTSNVQDDKLIKILQYLKWRHRIELFPGFYTPGYNTMPDDWSFNHFPEDLHGKSLLDVGANDGYFSFEAEKRGASRVCAIDIYGGDGATMYDGWDNIGILLAKEYLNSKVEVRNASVYDLKESGEKYDYVICSDVLSWLENIEEALAGLTAACKGKICIKDEFLTGYGSTPIVLYKGRKNSVTYRMNTAFIKEKLKALGFKVTRVKPINSRKHIEWQVINFPGVHSAAAIPLYHYPGSEVAEMVTLNGEWLLAQYEGFGFIFRKGWVRMEDIKVVPRFKKSIVKTLVKRAVPEQVMDWYYALGNSEKSISAFMIEAERK